MRFDVSADGKIDLPTKDTKPTGELGCNAGSPDGFVIFFALPL
jgi:hypothetical protein